MFSSLTVEFIIHELYFSCRKSLVVSTLKFASLKCFSRLYWCIIWLMIIPESLLQLSHNKMLILELFASIQRTLLTLVTCVQSAFLYFQPLLRCVQHVILCSKCHRFFLAKGVGQNNSFFTAEKLFQFENGFYK